MLPISYSFLHQGMTRINFQPYTTQQLGEIVHARLRDAKEGLEEPPDVIHADGIKFSAMKVSSISGDARRVLDICRYVSASPAAAMKLRFDVDEQWSSCIPSGAPPARRM